MSPLTRAARPEELERLWPAVASGHTFASYREFTALYEAGPWQIRLSAHDDAYVVSRWRSHLDVLAIRGLWAPPGRVPGLVADAVAIAAEHGFGRLMSPLLASGAAAPYRQAGMEDLEQLVAFSVSVGGVRARKGAAEHQVLTATAADTAELAELDRGCFAEFWRHGEAELLGALRDGERVTLVRDAHGRIIGSAVSAMSGSVVTIGRLAVVESARGTGVGSSLLLDAQAWAKESGAIGLSLCTQADNGPARRLYRASGFTEASEEYRLLVSRVP